MDPETRYINLMEQLNVGVVNYIESKMGTCDIQLVKKLPADRHAVLSWEQKNSCLLPEDLKSFYLTSDGFDMTWSVKTDNSTVPLGRMHINPVGQLHRLEPPVSKVPGVAPSLADMETDSDQEDEATGLPKPSFLGPNRLYVLDHCDGHGKTCLVYRESGCGVTSADVNNDDDADDDDDDDNFALFDKFGWPGVAEPRVEVWFLDRSLRWHYLAPTFFAYYRLMLVHLGLPQWQYAFTDIGLSQQAKQWFNLYSPVRLEIDTEPPIEAGEDDRQKSASVLDINKVFRGKTEKKKTGAAAAGPGGKKKQGVSSAKSSSSSGGKVSGSSSQASLKTK